nr:MAG TPA: helix-turn-helix domain protein [Caudoviricetes sp.]
MKCACMGCTEATGRSWDCHTRCDGYKEFQARNEKEKNVIKRKKSLLLVRGQRKEDKTKCFKQEQEGKKMISTARAIKKTREAQGMTQKELAERCGYTIADIKAYELGEKEPRHINLMNIAGSLGVTMYEMFERAEETEESENLNLDVIKNALSAHKAIVETPLDKITVMAFEELIKYKETGLKPDQVDGLKKRQEKIDLMAIEYDNIIEKYDKLIGKEQM